MPRQADPIKKQNRIMEALSKLSKELDNVETIKSVVRTIKFIDEINKLKKEVKDCEYQVRSWNSSLEYAKSKLETKQSQQYRMLVNLGFDKKDLKEIMEEKNG